jgi:hypothetical protein
MDFDTAMSTLARAAGDDVCSFLGEPRERVPEVEVEEAARWMLIEACLDGEPADMVGLSDQDRVSLVIREVQAKAIEAWWHEQGKRIMRKWRKPERRAALLEFLEARTGRPMPAHVGRYG